MTESIVSVTLKIDKILYDRLTEIAMPKGMTLEQALERYINIEISREIMWKEVHRDI